MIFSFLYFEYQSLQHIFHTKKPPKNIVFTMQYG